MRVQYPKCTYSPYILLIKSDLKWCIHLGKNSLLVLVHPIVCGLKWSVSSILCDKCLLSWKCPTTVPSRSTFPSRNIIVYLMLSKSRYRIMMYPDVSCWTWDQGHDREHHFCFLPRFTSVDLGGMVNFTLPSTTSEMISISTSQTFHSWVVIFHLRRPMARLSLNV